MDSQKVRLGLYRKIEIARKQLPDMTEEAFRDLLRGEFGVSSRKEMSVKQLSRLVDIFARRGVVFVKPKSSRPIPPEARRADWIEVTDSMPYARERRQILAIWRRLGYTMDSLDTRVKRAFGVECFEWLQDGKQISTLLSDLQRREKSHEGKAAARAGRATRAGQAGGKA